jgi:hypothetical protein
MIVSDAEEASKPQHRVGDFAADLVDHHPFDRANALMSAPTAAPSTLSLPMIIPPWNRPPNSEFSTRAVAALLTEADEMTSRERRDMPWIMGALARALVIIVVGGVKALALG